MTMKQQQNQNVANTTMTVFVNNPLWTDKLNLTFALLVIVARYLVCDEPLTNGHYDCACGNPINQKYFEVHKACSSDEDDFNTVHSYLKNKQGIRWINTSWLSHDCMSHNCKFCLVQLKCFTEIWPGLMCTTKPSWILKTCWLFPPLTTIKMQSASGFREMNQMSTANIWTKPPTQW